MTAQPPIRFRPATNGFSLVELMVALFIVAMLAGVVIMTLPASQADLRREAERLAARTIAARDEAIVASAPVALVIGTAGYYFEKRQDAQWRPLQTRTLKGGDWRGDTTVSVMGAKGNRRLVFDTLGLASDDLRVALSRDGNRMVVVVHRNGDVAVNGG